MRNLARDLDAQALQTGYPKMSEAADVHLVGSGFDLPTMRATPDVLHRLGMAFEVKGTSARRTPEATHADGTDADQGGRAAVIFTAGIAAILENDARLHARLKAEA